MPQPGVNIAVLTDVLEPFPDEASNQGNYKARDLSFYSTEQRTLDQAASLVAEARDGTWRLDDSHKRYFNTLRNNGVLGEPAESPTQTPISGIFYGEYQIAQKESGGKLTRDQKRILDRAILTYALDRIVEGDASEVSEPVKQVIRHIQDFFDEINPEQISQVIEDDNLAREIQAINIEGSEPARYFRLPPQRREEFDIAFSALLAMRDPETIMGLPENIRAYRDAAGRLQPDVRTRVQDALLAYHQLKLERGDDMPYLGVDLQAPKKVAKVQRVSRTAATTSLGPLQLIVSGCPGSGKSFWIDERLARANARVYRVQFHAELGFSEFIGSFKPRALYEEPKAQFTSAAGLEMEVGRPVIDYTFAPGPFTNALVDAYMNPNACVVIVIEEINRGNAAAAFGEVFQALDRNDDGRSRYPVVPQDDYGEYLTAKKALTDGCISLPPNLYVWASMNGADQNVHPLDTAFRRRWSYRYMGYTQPCLYRPESRIILYAGKSFDWEQFRGVLNEALIKFEVDEDKLIGPYFLSPRQLRDPDEVLNKLFLYLWDDALRFRRAELFRDPSFAKVGLRWENGAGDLLILDTSGIPSIEPVGSQGGDSEATTIPERPSDTHGGSPEGGDTPETRT